MVLLLLLLAAFIGPGTITVCSIAGVSYGYELLWALLIAVIATVILQEMAARIGFLTRKGLGSAVRSELQNKTLRLILSVLVLSAIIIGNAAYQGGNIAGASLGMVSIFDSGIPWPIILSILAGALLYLGKFRLIQNTLIALVLLMSLTFLVSVVLLKPSLMDILKGLIPSGLHRNSLLTVLAVVGTTVVPYNLFLHASAISSKWKPADPIRDVRIENLIAIGLGGLISSLVMISAAESFFGSGIEIKNAADMAGQLEPALGKYAQTFFGIGLFSAGLSSAVTAPLAAAYAASGLFGWGKRLDDWRFRAVWLVILIIGAVVASTDIRPTVIIQFAQIANGLLLPIMVIFLLVLCNRKSLLGKFTNSLWQNILGFLLLIFSLILAFKGFNAVFQFLN